MSLSIAHTGDVIYPLTINQCVYTLNRQRGQSETGHYFIAGNSYRVGGLYQSCPLTMLSRNATPVSMSVDQADTAFSSLNAPQVGHLKSGVAQIYASASATNINCFGGGNYVVQF